MVKQYKKTGYIELNNACNRTETPLQDGEAVITPTFNITNAKYIINAVGPDFGQTPNVSNELFDAYFNLLKILMENNLHTIAFPRIGSGILVVI